MNGAALTKRCPRCEKTKSVSEFCKNKSSYNGLCSYCKPCSREMDRIRRPPRGPNQNQIERKKLLSIGLKKCSLCKTIKPLKDFARDTQKSNGRVSRCKSCISPQHHTELRERKWLFKMGLKKCIKCKRIRSVNDFGPDRAESSRDGIACYCRNCCNENSRRCYHPQENEENRERRELAEAGLRKCPACNQTRTLDHFSAGNGYCKTCCRQWAAWYRENMPQHKAADLVEKYSNTTEGDPLVNAHRAVEYAILANILPRKETQRCADCGGPCEFYHHKSGYSPGHRLDVCPLCRRCHIRRHRLPGHKNKAKMRAAYIRINSAINGGILQPAKDRKCADCCGQARVYHHENGYDKQYQLDVVALCDKCHAIRHMRLDACNRQIQPQRGGFNARTTTEIPRVSH